MIELSFLKKLKQKANKKLEKIRFNKKIRRHTPVFVYQMGKVASSSIYYSIKQQYKGLVFHSHSFGKKENSDEIKALFDYYQKKRPIINIISLTREPISRNISAFFQNFKRDVGVEFSGSKLSVDELQGIFLKKYDHDIPIRWFDDNIKKNFGIDVYNFDFPNENHQFITKGNVNLLLMKHNLDDNIKQNLLTEYLKIADFELTNKNIGSQKEYSKAYNDFSNLKFSEDYLNRMLNNKYTIHFYKNELKDIQSKWRDT